MAFLRSYKVMQTSNNSSQPNIFTAATDEKKSEEEVERKRSKKPKKKILIKRTKDWMETMTIKRIMMTNQKLIKQKKKMTLMIIRETSKLGAIQVSLRLRKQLQHS